jgi:hypothetical protein
MRRVAEAALSLSNAGAIRHLPMESHFLFELAAATVALEQITDAAKEFVHAGTSFHRNCDFFIET